MVKGKVNETADRLMDLRNRAAKIDPHPVPVALFAELIDVLLGVGMDEAEKKAGE